MNHPLIMNLMRNAATDPRFRDRLTAEGPALLSGYGISDEEASSLLAVDFEELLSCMEEQQRCGRCGREDAVF